MSLEEFRNNIDFIDDQILVLLSERFEEVSKVIEFKKKNNLPILNAKREDVILNKIINEYKNYNQHFVNIYKKIMDESKLYQKNKLSDKNKSWV